MDLILWNMEKPPGFPWSLKKAMFLEQNLWSEICTFHPETWKGSSQQLKAVRCIYHINVHGPNPNPNPI